MMNDKLDLKPLLCCPFCGGKVELQSCSGTYGYTPPSIYIKCCDTHMTEHTETWEQGKGHYSIYEEALKRLADRWNTRA